MTNILRSLLALPLPTLLLAAPATLPAQVSPHQPPVAGRDPLSTTVVEVSTQRVRIAFPVDSSGSWRWPARQDRSIYGYVWGVHLVSLEGPVTASLATYHRDTTALSYSSLVELVSAGSTLFCLPSGDGKCRGRDLFQSTVENDRVVLTLTDSTMIHQLFATRPTSLGVYRHSVGAMPAYENDSVPVRYVSPYIPPPDSALLAEAARGQRRHEARITTFARHISGGEDWWNTDDLWLAAGDSVRLDIRETRCHYDHCNTFSGQVSDSGWSVKNTRIVLLRTCGPACAMAYGRRVGKTTISVRGLHGRSDTVPSRQPPPRKIERGIMVGRPIARIRIVPRADTALVGQPQTFGAQALDRRGRVVPSVPVEILVDTDTNSYDGMLATQPRPVEFRKPGRRTVIATFRGLADTLLVTVVESTKAR